MANDHVRKIGNGGADVLMLSAFLRDQLQICGKCARGNARWCVIEGSKRVVALVDPCNDRDAGPVTQVSNQQFHSSFTLV